MTGGIKSCQGVSGNSARAHFKAAINVPWNFSILPLLQDACVEETIRLIFKSSDNFVRTLLTNKFEPRSEYKLRGTLHLQQISLKMIPAISVASKESRT